MRNEIDLSELSVEHSNNLTCDQGLMWKHWSIDTTLWLWVYECKVCGKYLKEINVYKGHRHVESKHVKTRMYECQCCGKQL